MTGDPGLLSPVWAGTPAARRTGPDAVLRRLLHVEAAWAEVLAGAGHVPRASAEAVQRLAEDPAAAGVSPQSLAAETPAGGNPVIPMLTALRRTLQDAGAETAALHLGATSQDVVDTALVLLVRDAAAAILEDLQRAGRALSTLSDDHRDTLCIARSLTQHALPSTFGLRTALWLDGTASAMTRLDAAVSELPLQWGGSVGTQAALSDHISRNEAARLTEELATALGTAPMRRPWHTRRGPLLEVAAACTGVVAALGKIASDVLTLQRPEIGEVREPGAEGRGTSSAMPQKRNPVLSTLIRSATTAAPGHLSTLHHSASDASDERPDGAWHAEWPSLIELLRLTGGAAHRAAALLEGLEIRPAQMERNLGLSGGAVLGERLIGRLGETFPGGREALREILRHEGDEEGDLRTRLRRSLPRELLSDEELSELLDPRSYLGRAEEFIDSSMEDFRRGVRQLSISATGEGGSSDV